MRKLSKTDIRRTAYKKIDNWTVVSAYMTNRDKNEMCPSCKNEDTEIIKDKAYLKDFDEFWKNIPYKACYCFFCGWVWSFGGGFK